MKTNEVAERKERISLDDLMRMSVPAVRDIIPCLKENGLSIIAEIKRKSPSAGLIRDDFDPVHIADIYEKNGAAGISVLTDESFFGGSDEFIGQVKRQVHVPVLRKEFIVDSYQIYESRTIGADVILIIVRILTPDRVRQFIEIARSLGMAALVEVHSLTELEIAEDTGAEIIGINNRDLDTLKIDIQMSLNLKEKMKTEAFVISESGIRSREDMEMLEKAGFHGVLIGETLMRSKNIGETLRSLKGIK